MSDYNTPTGTVAPQAAMNVLSIVAFVLSLFGFTVIAIVLGAVGLSQIKRTGERGRGFALAAIWIGAISIVLAIVIVIAFNAALQLSFT
jgi:hypothetical protein